MITNTLAWLYMITNTLAWLYMIINTLAWLYMITNTLAWLYNCDYIAKLQLKLSLAKIMAKSSIYNLISPLLFLLKEPPLLPALRLDQN